LIRPEGGLEDAPAFVTNADGSTVMVMDCGVTGEGGWYSR
jgi:hypothetical protein